MQSHFQGWVYLTSYEHIARCENGKMDIDGKVVGYVLSQEILTSMKYKGDSPPVGF